MLHTPFALCLVTLRGIFMHFSETNLLTRCHSASSLFFCYFCVSEKLHRKYSRNWTKQKPNHLFFPKHHEVQRWDGGGPGARLTLGRRGPAPGRATRGWDHLVHPLTPPFCQYNPLDGKNVKDGSLFLETYYKPPPSSSRDWEDPGALLGTLPEAFSTTMVASGMMCE
jgi:hypothetical protein